MPGDALPDPRLRGQLVEVADGLSLANCVAFDADPHVAFAPGGVARGAQQVAGGLAVSEGDPAGGTFRVPRRLDVRPEIGDVGEQRLRLAVTRVALGEEVSGRVDVLVGKGLNLESRHRRRTIALGCNAKDSDRCRA